MLLSLFCINPSFATTSHNLYDAKGNLMASCGDNGCEYFIYQGVSRVGVVKEHQFTHQDNGIDGKAGELVRSHNGVQSSQLWVTDFHGSVIAKLTAEEPETILFNAFGGVLNESTNTEDCQDYHYTDKPRVGCTSLHNFNARFYDPKIGRFITSDPVEQHNLNWFTYANNNPLRFTDATGMAPMDIADSVDAKVAFIYGMLARSTGPQESKAQLFKKAMLVLAAEGLRGGANTLRFGEGMVKGGWGYGEDAVRALTIVLPILVIRGGITAVPSVNQSEIAGERIIYHWDWQGYMYRQSPTFRQTNALYDAIESELTAIQNTDTRLNAFQDQLQRLNEILQSSDRLAFSGLQDIRQQMRITQENIRMLRRRRELHEGWLGQYQAELERISNNIENPSTLDLPN